jgi:hypothetical protein
VDVPRTGGDIGGGNADFTWSALVGFEVRVMSWGAIEFGFKGLGIDISRDEDDQLVTRYQATHYGPIAGFRFHWGR